MEVMFILTFSMLLIVDINKLQGKLLFSLSVASGVGESFWNAVTSLLIAGRRHLWAALLSLGN